MFEDPDSDEEVELPRPVELETHRLPPPPPDEEDLAEMSLLKEEIDEAEKFELTFETVDITRNESLLEQEVEESKDSEKKTEDAKEVEEEPKPKRKRTSSHCSTSSHKSKDSNKEDKDLSGFEENFKENDYLLSPQREITRVKSPESVAQKLLKDFGTPASSTKRKATSAVETSTPKPARASKYEQDSPSLVHFHY